MTQGGFATSTGHVLSTANWLDLHFQICEPEYAALVKMAGFEPDWHVLDAGSGSGSYLKLLAEQVGTDGRLTALDLAPENITLIKNRIASEPRKPSIEAIEGSILDLPFSDGTFDGVWCANVTMYLSDTELRKALDEFYRVTRPGGLVAIKDFSVDISTLKPMPYGYFEHLVERHLECPTNSWRGSTRTWNLRSFLLKAGLRDVWQRSLLSEHRAPLTPENQQLQGDFMKHLATGALELELPEEEHDFWKRQLDPASPDAMVNQPDFYNAEAQMLAVGRVP
ncbi:MAG: methyltransferase domain-containing protein [Thermomicrobiales bacterium]